MAAETSRSAEPRVLVLFRLAGEDYGIDVDYVREIITWQQATRVPRTPPFVEGIINLRGHIIPVLDLRRRLGLPEGERDRSTRVVVVELDGTVVGLVVDAVSEVVRLPAATVEPPAEVLAVDASFIEGIARHGDRLILVLQPGQVLAPAEWQAVRAVQGTEGGDATLPAAGGDDAAGAVEGGSGTAVDGGAVPPVPGPEGQAEEGAGVADGHGPGEEKGDGRGPAPGPVRAGDGAPGSGTQGRPGGTAS